jgi:5-methylcytosine-specific restriction endonuclease McrA
MGCPHHDSFLFKLSPMDRFDTVIPHNRFEECAGANGDWIAMAGLRGKWELANMYTLCKISIPAVPFEAPMIQISSWHILVLLLS